MPTFAHSALQLGWEGALFYHPFLDPGPYYRHVNRLYEKELEEMANHTPEQIEQMDREASHIAYAISTAVVNSKVTDEERKLIKQLVTEAAQQLHIKMNLLLPLGGDNRPRFNISGYVKTSSSGQRKLDLAEEATHAE